MIVVRRVLPFILAAAALSAPAVAAPPEPVVSWGKAGVPYEQYLRDSIECGLRGHNQDVSATPQAKALRDASRRLESMDGTAPVADYATAGGVDPLAGVVQHARQMEMIKQGVRPEKQVADLKLEMQRAVAACLTERGYRRFTLDEAQTEHLKGLMRGTEARRHYLYSLASDAGVMERQALSAG